MKSSFTHRGKELILAWLCAIGVATASQANDIKLFQTVYNTDYVSAGIGCLRDNCTGRAISLSGISGTVTKAYLYWHGPVNASGLNSSIQVNGATVHGLMIGTSSDNCWGLAQSESYRAEVTAIVSSTGNGDYAITGYGCDQIKNTNGASIIVFFDDGNSSNNRDVVIFDGNDSNIPNDFDADGWSVSLSGINYGTGPVYIQLHVSDGEEFRDDALVMNGVEFMAAGPIFQGTNPAQSCGPTADGSLWDIATYDISTFVSPGPNTLSFTSNLNGDCLSLVVAILDLPAGAAPLPPVDTTPPILIVPENMIVSTDPGQPTAVVTYVVSATDNSGDPVTISCDIPSGFSFPVGTTTVTCIARDASGNSVTKTFTVTVKDTEPPKISSPANIIVSTDPGSGAAIVNYPMSTATDNVPGVTVSCMSLPGSSFPVGTTTITCTATDVAGNTATSSFTITVKDMEPPKISSPANIVVSTDPGKNFAIVNYPMSTATDNVPGVTVSCASSSGSQFPLGVTTVTCTATDVAGNIATSLFTITVKDMEPPKILVPANIIVTAAVGQNSAVVTYPAPTATDNVAGVTLSSSPASGLAFALGTTTITCIAKDAAGNTASGTFTITVNPAATGLNVSCSVGTGVLWPPNHNLVNVGFVATVAGSSAKPSIIVYSNEDDVWGKSKDEKKKDDKDHEKEKDYKKHDEDKDGDGDGGCSFSPDAKDIASGTLRLRSEREGDGKGRVYLIITKGASGTSSSFCYSSVVVPHDQSKESIKGVNAMADAAKAYAASHGGAPPAGYYIVGDGPNRSKNGDDKDDDGKEKKDK